MESDERRGFHSLSPSSFDMNPPAEPEMNHSYEQLVTTQPRKRLSLDLDTATDKISSRVTIRNRSSGTIAFKTGCSVENGYVVDPDRGILGPGVEVQVDLVLDENSDLDREIEQDQFTITVAAHDLSVNEDLDAFFSNTFDTLERLENHTLQPAFTVTARERAHTAGEEQLERKRKETDLRHVKMILLPAFGLIMGLAFLYACVTDFCVPFCD